MRLHLEHRDVGHLVAPHHLGAVLAPVDEPHQHLVGVGDHVVVGDDVTLAIEDEARPRAADWGHLAGPVPGGDAEEAPEGLRDLLLGDLALLLDLYEDDRRQRAVRGRAEGGGQCVRLALLGRGGGLSELLAHGGWRGGVSLGVGRVSSPPQAARTSSPMASARLLSLRGMLISLGSTWRCMAEVPLSKPRASSAARR